MYLGIPLSLQCSVFPVMGRCCPFASTKLYCFMTDAHWHVCERLAQNHYVKLNGCIWFLIASPTIAPPHHTNTRSTVNRSRVSENVSEFFFLDSLYSPMTLLQKLHGWMSFILSVFVMFCCLPLPLLQVIFYIVHLSFRILSTHLFHIHIIRIFSSFPVLLYSVLILSAGNLEFFTCLTCPDHCSLCMSVCSALFHLILFLSDVSIHIKFLKSFQRRKMQSLTTQWRFLLLAALASLTSVSCRISKLPGGKLTSSYTVMLLAIWFSF